jgi:hypothetical protein
MGIGAVAARKLCDIGLDLMPAIPATTRSVEHEPQPRFRASSVAPVRISPAASLSLARRPSPVMGVGKRTDEVTRSVIANDRDGTTSGRWMATS